MIEEQVSKEDEESRMKSSIKSNFSDGIRIPEGTITEPLE